MSHRSLVFLFPLLLGLTGCADDSSSSATRQTEEAPSVAPAGSETATARQAPTAAVTTRAVIPPAPTDASRVVVGRSASTRTLNAWAADAEATPQVRVNALRSLEARGKALEAAQALALDPQATPYVRSNAVAVLARSDDPKAAALIAQLPKRYQRLAHKLRHRAKR